MIWLLPLLEGDPDEIAATLDGHATPSPLPDLVGTRSPPGEATGPALALGWLEASQPTTDVLDVLTITAFPRPGLI